LLKCQGNYAEYDIYIIYELKEGTTGRQDGNKDDNKFGQSLADTWDWDKWRTKLKNLRWVID